MLLRLQGRAEGVVGLNLRHPVAAGGRLDIEAGTPAEDRDAAPGEDVLVRPFEVLLVLVDIVAGTGGGDVDQMIRDIPVFSEILPGADVHAAVHLAGVGREDLGAVARQEGVQGMGEPDGIARLARCGRAEDADEVDVSFPPRLRQGGGLDVFRRGQFGHRRDARPVGQQFGPVQFHSGRVFSRSQRAISAGRRGESSR